MNMQDYRHAADRIHIAEHCEKEVLSMTQNTEQKTRRPLLRTATGIAAAAACVGLTGALGFALYRMGHDEADLPAADSAGTESVTEQSAADSAEESSQIGTAEETCEDFITAYYEKAAGHPVSYDWSSLCGTNLNEVWETAGGTVTLKAAVTDGYQLYYYYTFKPNFDWDSVNWDEPLNEETGKLMPNLIVVPADLHLQENLRYGDSPAVRLDDTLREDGTVRFYKFFGSEMAGLPLPENGEFVAYHLGSGGSREESRRFTVNMPQQMPEWHELSSPLHIANDGTAYGFGSMEADYRYALVTPLGAILTENALDERIGIMEEKKANGGTGQPLMADSLSVMKLTPSGGKANAPYALFGSFGECSGMCSIDMAAVDHDPDERQIFSVCTLRFRVPQDLSDAVGMEFTSSAQDEAVTVDLTPEKLPFSSELDPDLAEINVISEPAETAVPETTETAAEAVQVPAETKINTQKSADTQTAEALIAKITEQLNALTWSSETCDGLPEYQWTAADGTVYRLNLSSRWVWKRTGGTMQEAHLTKNLLDLFSAYQAGYGLEECEY